MGKFERKARRAQEQRQEEGADSFDALPGKTVLRAKVEYPQDGEGPPIVHTRMGCNGQELVMALAIILADWCKHVAVQRPGEATTDLDLSVMCAQIQMGAAETLSRSAD